MSWLSKSAEDETNRIENNIKRLMTLMKDVHELGLFGVASQSGGYRLLQQILDRPVVKGRKDIEKILKSALIGENNQKLVLDAPKRFKEIMFEAEKIIKKEIVKEKRKLSKLKDDE